MKKEGCCYTGGSGEVWNPEDSLGHLLVFPYTVMEEEKITTSA